MLHTDKLDDAFLFVLAVATLGFTITQTATQGIHSLVYAVPVLLSGVALPFYVGYFRGAVLLDSGPERVRGWVILAMGNFVMLSLVVTDYTKQSWALYSISLIGIVVAIFLGTRLAAAYPIAADRRMNLLIAGGAATGFFFPIVAYLSASLVQVVWTGPYTQLAAFYLIYLYLTGVFVSILVVMERTSEVLASGEELRAYGGEEPNGMERTLNQLDKSVFFSLLDFLMVAVDPVYRVRKVVLLWVAGFIAFVIAGNSITWFHENWLPVGAFAFVADALIALSIFYYLRIERAEVLPMAAKCTLTSIR